ncbi:MAG: hypothetical protein Q8O03_07080 [Nanoarchaeota archaeon]|nr:hypothetical protein [Nanoarchaeota archaeon]
MKNLKKKLLTMVCITGMIGLGYVLPARAFEPKIPIDGSVIQTEIKEFDTGQYKGTMTTKTLENGITVQDFDYGSDGIVEGRIARQEFPEYSIQELDKGADRNIEVRGTFYNDGSMIIEKQLPDGSIKKEVIK